MKNFQITYLLYLNLCLNNINKLFYIIIIYQLLGESEATARQYLSLADGNVETAISLMFDGSQAPEPLCTPDPEPEVRPPILPMQEVLVPSGPICSLPRLSTNVFDRFRDFAVETRKYYFILIFY